MAASKTLTAARHYGSVCAKHIDYEGLRNQSNGCVACAGEKEVLKNKLPSEKKKRRDYDSIRTANPDVTARKAEVDFIRNSKPENKLRKAELDAIRSADKEIKARKAETDLARYSTPEGYIEAFKKVLRRRGYEKTVSISFGPDDYQHMVEYYQIRNDLTAQHGISHDVDHIQSIGNPENEMSGVCGLNVGLNLRVIPASQNVSKGSKSYICKEQQWNEFGDNSVNPRLSNDSPKWR